VRAQKKEEERAKQKKNIYANNYIDTDAIEDFDDFQGPEQESKVLKI
jgi:hypothetical protein